MDFSDALLAAKQGKKVRRAMWAEPNPAAVGVGGLGTFMELVTIPASDGKQFQPSLQCWYPEPGIYRSFTGGHWDLLADDWEIAEDAP